MSSYYSPGNPNAWNTIETDPLGNWAVLRKPAAQWGISAATALGVVLLVLAMVPFAIDLLSPWSKIGDSRIRNHEGGIACFLCDTLMVTEFYASGSGRDFATGKALGMNMDERGFIGGVATVKLIAALAAAGFIVFTAKTSLAGKFPPFQPKSPYDRR